MARQVKGWGKEEERLLERVNSSVVGECAARGRDRAGNRERERFKQIERELPRLETKGSECKKTGARGKTREKSRFCSSGDIEHFCTT
jgi:hypothetical protein